jgi:hypothetical protein
VNYFLRPPPYLRRSTGFGYAAARYMAAGTSVLGNVTAWERHYNNRQFWRELIIVEDLLHRSASVETPCDEGTAISAWSTLSYSDTPHYERLLWKSDLPVAETYTRQHSQETDIHHLGGFRTRNPNMRAAVDPHLRPRGHWDHHQGVYTRNCGENIKLL